MLDADPSPPAAPVMIGPAEPLAALALALLDTAQQSAVKPLVHVASQVGRAEALRDLLAALAPELRLGWLPAWDCLPFDTALASPAVMGVRAGLLRWLTDHASPPDLVLTTPAALIQRVPPQQVWGPAHLELRQGETIEPEAVKAYLERVGYIDDERVDEPGEFALRGRVLDLFPAAASWPCRVEHEEGRITAIRSYDPVSQRSVGETDLLLVGPASEIIRPSPAEGGTESESGPAWLCDVHDHLETVLDYLPQAPIVLETGAQAAARAFIDQVEDAHRTRLQMRGSEAHPPVPPERLFLGREEWEAAIQARLLATVDDSKAEAGAPPRFVEARQPGRAFKAFLGQEREAGRTIVLAAATAPWLARLMRRAEAALGQAPRKVDDWRAVRAAPAGDVLGLRLPIDAGFVLPSAEITVIAAADLFGSRADTAARPRASLLPESEAGFRIGDAVVHWEHGMGVLEGLEEMAAGDDPPRDMIRLRYADEAGLMVPVDEVGAIWRYGADAETVTLDRLDGERWPRRRAEVEADIRATAARLLELAHARQQASAPKLVPPARDYERFVGRFPFRLTPDQDAAVAAVLADLAAGRPMDRLVCGDVGYGKTEVALRAAAAVAFAGRQVALIAPTTVLVRQHLQTFQRRFAGFGIEVAQLSRLEQPAEARKIKAGLASGAIRIVVGTHALAAKDVRFQDLGLVVIDEEQRFGTAQKTKLRALGQDRHVLTLTATPIPRTLQAALVGLQDTSVILTPPVQRRPIRTVLQPFEPARVRQALCRERQRGGQSFLVCPRVEDIEPMAARLKTIVPDLETVVAHGKLPPARMDEAMLRFANGEGDVLLATNIIESGLDLPRANTMLIWRPDRFGLAQLHQLRGRVGRGTRRGTVHLLADPEKPLGRIAEKRLRTLTALDRPGAGFAISARDLDLRGGGELLGEEQAGQMKLIGIGLYRHLLERAAAAARGEKVEEDWSPELHLGVDGRIPADYVPEDEVRLDLHARLHRAEDETTIQLLEDEIADRFGPLAEPVTNLLALARLELLCRQLRIARLDAGPRALAATFKDGLLASLPAAAEDMHVSGERFIWSRGSEEPAERLALAASFLEHLASARLS